MLLRGIAIFRNVSIPQSLRHAPVELSWKAPARPFCSARQFGGLSTLSIRRDTDSKLICWGSSFKPEVAQCRRRFSVSPSSLHGHLTPPKPGEEINVTIIDKEGEEHEFVVANGDNLLDIAQANDLEMEGACGGSCACSTCHVIVEDQEMYDKIPEPDDDENDMLDLAFGLTETSRLGCQVKVRPEMNGMKVRLPAMTRNMQASDFNANEKS